MVDFDRTTISDCPIKKKVAIYIFDPSLENVLTFLQPDSPGSGRQVPAGTLEIGEEHAAAAVRELIEETGCLEAPSLVAFARSFYDMRQYKPELHDRSWFFGVDTNGSFPKESWIHIEEIPGGGQIRAVFEWVPVGSASEFIAGHGHMVPLALHLAKCLQERVG